jgi:hypothetical protein
MPIGAAWGARVQPQILDQNQIEKKLSKDDSSEAKEYADEHGDENLETHLETQNSDGTINTVVTPEQSVIQNEDTTIAAAAANAASAITTEVSLPQRTLSGKFVRTKKRRATLASRTLRAAKQAILLRRSYQWRQRDDTQILASFCPSFLLEQVSLKKDLTPCTFFKTGACLIADISGFVKLCGRLSALGVNGIDDLRKCTNSFIGELVNTVYKRGGDGEFSQVVK